MKQFRQLQFNDLHFLLGKFSLHIERGIAKKLYEEYKKYLFEVHYKFPQNEVLAQKVKESQDLAACLETIHPGELKTKLQKCTTEVIGELGKINLRS